MFHRCHSLNYGQLGFIPTLNLVYQGKALHIKHCHFMAVVLFVRMKKNHILDNTVHVYELWSMTYSVTDLSQMITVWTCGVEYWMCNIHCNIHLVPLYSIFLWSIHYLYRQMHITCTRTEGLTGSVSLFFKFLSRFWKHREISTFALQTSIVIHWQQYICARATVNTHTYTVNL